MSFNSKVLKIADSHVFCQHTLKIAERHVFCWGKKFTEHVFTSELSAQFELSVGGGEGGERTCI